MEGGVLLDAVVIVQGEWLRLRAKLDGRVLEQEVVSLECLGVENIWVVLGDNYLFGRIGWTLKYNWRFLFRIHSILNVTAPFEEILVFRDINLFQLPCL